MSKYKVGLIVHEEWRNIYQGPLGFAEWLKEQDKPADPVLEKLTEFMKWYDKNRYTGLRFDDNTLTKFKEIFADDLNGTRGLDEAIEEINKTPKGTREYWVKTVKAIKERLQTNKEVK